MGTMMIVPPSKLHVCLLRTSGLERAFWVPESGTNMKCEIQTALRSITTCKTSGGDGIAVELFQILTDEAVKVLHSIC